MYYLDLLSSNVIGVWYAQTHKLSQMDIQPGGVDVLKFGFGDWKNVYEKRRSNPIFPKIHRKLDVWMGENGKKSI